MLHNLDQSTQKHLVCLQATHKNPILYRCCGRQRQLQRILATCLGFHQLSLSRHENLLIASVPFGDIINEGIFYILYCYRLPNQLADKIQRSPKHKRVKWVFLNDEGVLYPLP